MTSEICLYHLATGEVTSVLSVEAHVEAPNWHPDGYLLVNGGGRLYRVPLAAPRLEPVPTGPATALNNDHGVSPDGRLVAFSDKTEGGQSCIYVMPVGGGSLRRVTPEVPSWFHGWSPEGRRMVYAGARQGGPVAVYSCALDGTDERALTDGFDHADGPDYSADGRWIWFNGERDGAVDLWRVRADGDGAERMTDGPTVDWFPHPSPDGRHVVYLCYPPGTKGHPGGCEVGLRLMPQEGGDSREALRLFGGQGTINVPSWSPDSAAFAFVRYS